jgi:hypothetical protein
MTRKPTRRNQLPPSVTSKTLSAWVARNLDKEPPWESPHHNEDLKKLDRRWLFEWTLCKLDEADAAADRADWDVLEAEYRRRQKAYNPEKERAFLFKRIGGGRVTQKQAPQDEIEADRRGDVELLRRRYPWFARMINRPKLDGRGKHWPKKLTAERKAVVIAQDVAAAVHDVKRIRNLWQQELGKKNRGEGEGPTALDIAAYRWGIEVEQVKTAINHPSKKIPAR